MSSSRSSTTVPSCGGSHNRELLVLAVILNIKTFGAATLLLVALLVGVTLLHRKPTRPCHRCGERVPLERRTCRNCGYDFEPIRTTR